MKPLVYYCRWQKATLRLRGRDSEAVWGQMVQKNSDGEEKTIEFRYLLDNAQLFILQEGEEQYYHLDEKGVPSSED